VTDAIAEIVKLFNFSMKEFGYEFTLKKRLLKRLWGVLIQQVMNAQDCFKKQKDSIKV
jgi:hypothetical protein